MHGVERWRGPWLLVSKLPLLHLALPSRFPIYAWLAVAVDVRAAAWRAPRARRSPGRWCCSRCCRSLPSRAAELWKTPVPLPALFADGNERSVIRTTAP